MTEPLKKGTLDLLSELDTLDAREDHVVDDLLARGARMDELLAGRRVLTVGELGALKDALAKLETTIKDVEAGIARAEAAAAPGAPGAAPSFAELTAEIHSHGAEADRLRAVLRERLVALGAATGAEQDGGSLTKHTDGQPRTFRLTTPPMKGTDVTSFQRVLNARFAAWGIHAHVAENGEFDAHTRQAARRALLGLGVLSDDYAHGITPALRSLIRTPSRRTPAQVERAEGPAPLPGQAAPTPCQGARPLQAHRPPDLEAVVQAGHEARLARSRGRKRRGGDPRARRPLRGHRRARGQALERAGVAHLRRAPDRDGLPQRLRPRQRPQPDQEPAAAGPGPRGHRGPLPQLPAPSPPRPGQPGRRADAAHEPRPAGPRRQARRHLAAGPEHPGRRRAAGLEHQAARSARGRARLQRQRRRRRALRHEGPRARARVAFAAAGHAANGHAAASGHASRERAADVQADQPADGRRRRPGLPEDAQRPVRRVGHPPPRRRGRPLRPGDAARRAPGRDGPRPGDRGVRARHHARGPQRSSARRAGARTSSSSGPRASAATWPSCASATPTASGPARRRRARRRPATRCRGGRR